MCRFRDTLGTGEQARIRLPLRPGMTGLAQISGWTTFEEMLRLDYLYAARWTLRLDLKILLRTVPAVLRHCPYR